MSFCAESRIVDQQQLGYRIGSPAQPGEFGGAGDRPPLFVIPRAKAAKNVRGFRITGTHRSDQDYLRPADGARSRLNLQRPWRPGISAGRA